MNIKKDTRDPFSLECSKDMVNSEWRMVQLILGISIKGISMEKDR